MNSTSSESWYSSPSCGISSTDSIDDVTYEYDALGRRVQRDDGTTATVFVQNGQQTFADYTSGTAATSPTYVSVRRRDDWWRR